MLKKNRREFLRKSTWRLLGVIITLVVMTGVSAFLLHLSYPAVVETLDELDDDANSVLFGTATVVLMVVTILVALLAFFGWASIRDKVEFEVDRRLEERKLETAWNRINVGAIYGLLAEYHCLGYHPDMLIDQSITYTEGALEFEEIKGTPAEIVAKNNLAFQLALRASYGRQTVSRHDARRTLKYVEEMRDRPGTGRHRLEIALTRGRVIAKFAEPAEAETLGLIKESIREIEALAESEGVPQHQMTEMRRTRELLKAAKTVAENSVVEDRVWPLAKKLAKAFWKRLRP